MCLIDSGSWTPCTSPKAYTRVARGAHTFSVKQMDPAGNESPIQSTQWRVVGPAPVPPRGQVGFSPNAALTLTSGAKVLASDISPVSLIWPTGARRVILSNQPNFSSPGIFHVELPITWKAVDAAPGTAGTVMIYAKFTGDPGVSPTRVYRSLWQYDRARPTISAASISGKSGASPFRWQLSLRASDAGTGVKLARIWRSPRPPGSTGVSPIVVHTTNYATSISFNGSAAGGRPSWVQVEDQVGNKSDWYLIR